MTGKNVILGAALIVFSTASAWAFGGGEEGARHKDGKRIEKFFEKSDLNGDGVVTEEEFLQKAKEKFAKLDQDGDGKVTMEEIKARHKAMKDKHEKGGFLGKNPEQKTSETPEQ